MNRYTQQEEQVIKDCISNRRTTLKAAFKKAGRLLKRKPGAISGYYYHEMKNGKEGTPKKVKAQQIEFPPSNMLTAVYPEPAPVETPLLAEVKKNSLWLAKLLVEQLTAEENLQLFEYMVEKDRFGK